MERKIFSLIIALALIVGILEAQQNPDSKRTNILEALSTPDSITHATVKIHQDKRIESLLASRKLSTKSQDQNTANGYRVQVFSSNIQRSGKTEAFKIEKQIQEVFPDQTVYVNYSSPFWKVRVGDFLTQVEARAFRTKLIEAFPTMKSEIYIVREQIIISGSK
ncbi:MAG: SPOR domain-containing protein [Bacteroidota bacterium]|nr:SPOR domain-containing protein [Bacteroidota bacterium]